MLQGRLCEAIRSRFLVQLRYGADRESRLFAPHIVYRSGAGNLLVGGAQVLNPAKPGDEEEPRFFNLQKIHDLHVTAERFAPRPWFDPADPRFAGGIVCVLRRGGV